MASTPSSFPSGSYRLKKIRFFGRTVPILCQNENGPCPLLAIANTLLLQRHLEIHPDHAEVSLQRIIEMVANRVLEANPPVCLCVWSGLGWLPW
jgi:ubiquitin carboxyl-terminal hydrolase MINDY-1/2